MFALAKRSIGLFCLLFALVASLLSPAFGKAATAPNNTGDLLQGQIAVSKLADTNTDVALGPRCTNMTVQVMRNVLNVLVATPEVHCMFSTSGGLIDSQNRIVQPLGMPKAYPLHINHGGHPVLMPIEGSTSVLFITGDPVYPGANIGIYNDFFARLTFSNNPFDMSYTLSGEPNAYLHYPEGRNLAANITGSTLSFANSGRYIVIDGVYQGFMRVDLMTLQTTTFAADLPRVNDYGLLWGATAVSNSGRYAAVAYSAPGGWGSKYLKIIDADSCSTGISSCKTVDIYNQLKSAVPSIGSIDRVDFASENSLLVTGKYDFDGQTWKEGQFAITPAGQSGSREEYLAMGDSYISGEGAGSYLLGTDTSENKCHQSLVSYPYLIGKKLSSVASVACSSANMMNVRGPGNISQYSQVTHPENLTPEDLIRALQLHTPGVVKQTEFLQDNPTIITLSIGGNDVGFADIVTKCISPLHTLSEGQNCYATYEERIALIDQINNQFDNLLSTYDQIKKNAPDRRVYIIGYPQIVNPEGSCGANVHLSKSDAMFAVQLIDYLDGVIAKAALKAGVSYVDTQHAFDGHKLCDNGEKAVNGLTKGDDKIPLMIANESYHPNAYGHELLADAISRATNNLTTPMPVPQDVANPVADPSLPILQDASSTHEQIYDIQNVNTSTQELLFRGGDYAVPASSSPANLAPNSAWSAVLHSTPVQLGTVYSDASGVIAGMVHIPDNIPAGFHTIHYYGKNIAGDLIDIQDVVYVAASANDYDGDGVLNDNDSCPAMPQSGSDVDKDGIDDACDGDIGTAPILPSPTRPSDSSPAPTASFVLTNVNDIAPQGLFDIAHINLATTANNATQNPTLEPQVLHAMVDRPAIASYPKHSTVPTAKTSNLLRVGLGAFGLLIIAGLSNYVWRLKTK